MAPTDKPTLARAQGSRWTSALHPALLSPCQSTGPVMPMGSKSGGPILFRRCPHAPIEPMFSEGRHVPLGLQRREWWLSGWVDLGAGTHEWQGLVSRASLLFWKTEAMRVGGTWGDGWRCCSCWSIQGWGVFTAPDVPRLLAVSPSVISWLHNTSSGGPVKSQPIF